MGERKNYCINPMRQRRQLRDHGFETVEILGGGRLVKYVHLMPYYVAKKVAQ